MKSLAALVFTAGLAASFAPLALAQRQTFVVKADPSEVKITLKTNHETVYGTFHAQSGVVDFDRGTAKMAGSVVVQAGSGKTGSDLRDKRMNKEILKVEQYTSVTFEPKAYTGTLAEVGDSTLQVTGIFTLLGTPHDITIPMLVHIDPAGATAKAHFVVPYVQWGLKNPSLMIWKAEKDVDVDLNLVGTITK
jgi:polyisoprenoid-binding protein YceI